MGKPFSNELKHVPATIKWADALDVSSLTKFLSQAQGHTLHSIGAGGSYTNADFARLLYEAGGGTALAHTPLAFIQSQSDIRDAYVLIFTASGNNRDTLATYEAAIKREPQVILIICGKSQSKIVRKARSCERTVVFAHPIPTGRDGYLATNSLAAFFVVTLRAFGHPPANLSKVINALTGSPRKWAAQKLPAGPAFYLALFGGWSRPAATDFESKFSEAGLGGVMLADYRNFAHGRHNWIDKQGDHSTVVAFITPDSAQLANRTLALLPLGTRIIRLETNTVGAAGTMELLLQVFQLTSFVGQLVGIDPGRPGIPGYGSKIFHLGPAPGVRKKTETSTDAPVRRKLSIRGTLANALDRKHVTAALGQFAARLQGARYGALVMDFDGTVVPPGAGQGASLSAPIVSFFQKLLRNGIPLYFATGRGDSIHPILASSLAKQFHSRVFISYYNGALTLPLSEPGPKPNGGPYHHELDALKDRIVEDPLICESAKLENKSYQLTLKAVNRSEFTAVAAVIREIVARHTDGKMRVVQSSHSLDVIPKETTKLNCVQLARTRLLAGTELLTIGDRGSIPGNDYDLLTHPYSLSVDTVSADLHSCWNLLPTGVRNVSGLLYYAKWFRANHGQYSVNVL